MMFLNQHCTIFIDFLFNISQDWQLVPWTNKTNKRNAENLYIFFSFISFFPLYCVKNTYTLNFWHSIKCEPIILKVIGFYQLLVCFHRISQKIPKKKNSLMILFFLHIPCISKWSFMKVDQSIVGVRRKCCNYLTLKISQTIHTGHKWTWN